MSTDAESEFKEIRVEVAYATPEKQSLVSLDVPVGCTVARAIELSGILQEFPGLEPDPNALGIFSRKVPSDHCLSAGDRVEIYRPLIADPKEQRKQRARKKAESS
jgi:putative ubiquitin-RnfH superfamily antitoxin RatB of RatAB toxin-antitoxin module